MRMKTMKNGEKYDQKIMCLFLVFCRIPARRNYMILIKFLWIFFHASHRLL